MIMNTSGFYSTIIGILNCLVSNGCSDIVRYLSIYLHGEARASLTATTLQTSGQIYQTQNSNTIQYGMAYELL